MPSSLRSTNRCCLYPRRSLHTHLCKRLAMYVYRDLCLLQRWHLFAAIRQPCVWGVISLRQQVIVGYAGATEEQGGQAVSFGGGSSARTNHPRLQPCLLDCCFLAHGLTPGENTAVLRFHRTLQKPIVADASMETPSNQGLRPELCHCSP